MKITPAVAGAKGLWARLRRGRGRRSTAHYEWVLGTSLELQVVSTSRAAARDAEDAGLAEIDRLEAIFTTYSADSEFSRWQTTHDRPTPVSPELAALLRESEAWRVRTGGAYNPAVEALTRLWSAHAERGEPVGEGEVATVTRQLDGPLWSVDPEGGTARRLTRLPASLNAFAKGYIIDRAARAAGAVPGVRELILNLGGDLRHLGEEPAAVAIASPFHDGENAPPAAIVRIRGEGLATSGGYRRGFQVGDRWLSHLIDPRTGHPAHGVASASVVAADTATADVLTTALSILPPAEGLALADSLGVSCFLVTDDGAHLANDAWRARAIEIHTHGAIA